MQEGFHRVGILCPQKKPLRIGVPTTAAFQEFVRVDHNHHTSGFSIDVFQKVAENLKLPYEFVPRNISYDDLLREVNKKVNQCLIV